MISRYGFALIHALLALTLPFLLLAITSCVKAPELNSEGLGPQASDDDVERVISKALYGVDPWKSAVGQQVVYDLNARIENQEQIISIARLTQTVLQREEIGSKLKLTVQSHDLDLDTGKVEKSEGTQEYDSGIQSAAITALKPLQTLKAKTTESRPIVKITYHNLSDTSGVMAPPNAVKARENCGEVPNCELRYIQIAYDEVLWYNEQEFDVQKWQFTISRDAPFLGYILERCLAQLQPVNGRRYYIRQCQFARDFRYSCARLPDDQSPTCRE